MLWGHEDSARPRTIQMTRINMRKIKPTYTDARCNLTPDIFQRSVSCTVQEWNSAALRRAVHETGKYGMVPPHSREKWDIFPFW